MVKIPFVDRYKKGAKNGVKKDQEALMKHILLNLKTSEFDDEDVKKFLIEAFEQIVSGVDANKALLLNSGVSGKSSNRDFWKDYDIGEEIDELHNVLIEGKTKNRKRKTPLDSCIAKTAIKHNISHDKAKKCYEFYKEMEKIRYENS